MNLKMTDLFLEELKREAVGTRKALERVPEGHNDWKPHPKSMPLGYLASLVATMPGWMQPFAKYQPVTPMVNAVRSLTVGGHTDVVLALIWSAALLVVFTPVAVMLYRRA